VLIRVNCSLGLATNLHPLRYPASVEETDLPLRERKRRRTRALLIETGRRLFEERGYDETTVADIAAAAEIGSRTFFAYFETKEQLLFPDADPRVTATMAAIRTRSPSDTPVDVLLSGFDSAAIDEESRSPVAHLRQRLMRDVAPIQARAMRLQFDAQRQITDALLEAYPALAPVEAAALVGAFIGAVAAAFQSLGDEGDPAHQKHQVRKAVTNVLKAEIR
jgi:AcrR family transcriptional regulator